MSKHILFFVYCVLLNGLICQYALADQQASLDTFCTPIKFTQSGLRCFFKHVYQRPEYGPEFLALNFNHLVQFLAFIQKYQLREYARATLNIFNQRLKTTPCISAYAFDTLLVSLAELLQPYFVASPHIKAIESQINTTLYNAFLERFEEFKDNPMAFLQQLSTTIYLLTQEHTTNTNDQDISVIDLRHMLMRFLEHGLNKLIWSSHDQENVWPCIRSIADNILEFGQAGILPDTNDLDDLMWSLICRFGYFIELTGSHIPLETYIAIEHDLEENPHPLFLLEEQEDYIETKLHYLQRCVLLGKAKAHAYQAGLITDIL